MANWEIIEDTKFKKQVKGKILPTNTYISKLSGMSKGGAIITSRGQWDYPGQTTIIPSNEITMQGVNYPVLGVDNTGYQIMMQPKMNYTFPGQYVTEYPMMQVGGKYIPKRYIPESIYPEPSKNYTGNFLPINTDPYGNARKKLFDNKNGNPSTESVIGINDDSGYYNIPTVINGVRLSNNDAIDYFYNNGMYHTGHFNTQEEADKSADYRERANIGLYSTGLYKNGGEVNFNYAGENHRVYKKQSPTGNGKGIQGHIMVNHPTTNKGKWDTIDLTKISNGRIKTISQGVASTKKWHDENPDSYQIGGNVSFWKIIEDLPKAKNGTYTNPPTYVTDRNDPRLRAYNDSLNTHNYFLKNNNELNKLFDSTILPNAINRHDIFAAGFNPFSSTPIIPTNEAFRLRNNYYQAVNNVIKNRPAFEPNEINKTYFIHHPPQRITGLNYVNSIKVNRHNFSFPSPTTRVEFKPKQEVKLQSTKTNFGSNNTRTHLVKPFYKPIPVVQKEEIIPFTKMGLENIDSLQSMQKLPIPSPITSIPKDYYTITTGSSYKNPETGAFQQKTFKIDKVTGKKIGEEYFKQIGGNVSNWEILEDTNEDYEYKNGGKTPAWQRKEGKSPTGGLNAKGRASLKKEGHNIKPPQPQGGPRKKSFCARMKGMKKKLTGSKKANDPNSRINLSLRKWKC